MRRRDLSNRFDTTFERTRKEAFGFIFLDKRRDGSGLDESVFGKADIGASQESVLVAGGMAGMPEQQEAFFHFAGALRPRPTK